MSKIGNLNEKDKDFGYIYVVESLDLFKIGKTKYPEVRIKSIQMHNPHNPHYIICEKTYLVSHLESELHLMFKDKVSSGEWFSLEEKDITDIRNHVIRKKIDSLEILVSLDLDNMKKELKDYRRGEWLKSPDKYNRLMWSYIHGENEYKEMIKDDIIIKYE